jgi:hypothetical protein
MIFRPLNDFPAFARAFPAPVRSIMIDGQSPQRHPETGDVIPEIRTV